MTARSGRQRLAGHPSPVELVAPPPPAPGRDGWPTRRGRPDDHPRIGAAAPPTASPTPPSPAKTSDPASPYHETGRVTDRTGAYYVRPTTQVGITGVRPDDIAIVPHTTYASIRLSDDASVIVNDLDAAIAIGEAIVRQARKLKAEAAQAAAPFVSDETAEIARVVPTAVVP